MPLLNFISALALMLLTSNASALSIGNVQGSVVLGRPLNVTFPIASAGQPLEDVCIRVAVLAGDAALSASQVRTAFVPALAGREAALKVQTTQAIAEPVLTIRVTAGCDGSVARNFTLLAYPESNAARSADTSLADVSAGVAAASTQIPSSPGGSSARGVRSEPPPQASSDSQFTGSPKESDTATRASANPVKSTRPERRATRRLALTPAAPAVVQSQPRLVMEPLSDWLNAPAALRYSPEMANIPAEAESSERIAAASMWRALNLPPDELAGALMLSARQASQLAQAAREKADATAAQARLQAQVDDSYPAKPVYVLLAALILLACVALWLWSRSRRQASSEPLVWSQTVAKVPEPQNNQLAGADTALIAVKDRLRDDESGLVAPTEPEVLSSGMIPLEFGELHSELPAAVSAARRGGGEPESNSNAPAHVVVNPEALFDLQQQAEFFVSVGEHVQAIHVLKQHIEENQATSPLAYLELLRLYRSLSRFGDFDNLRAQMHLYFNAQVPEFNAFTRRAKDLFSYPDELARIEALWADASVVALLKEMLFRDSKQEDQRYELPAYDDLLLLYAIASTTSPSARGEPVGRLRTAPTEAELPKKGSFGVAPEFATPTANLIEFEPDWDFELPAEALAATYESRPSGSIELDLDLSELARLEDDARREKGEGSSLAPLPQVPDTAERGAGQPHDDQLIGFGANSDRLEARLDPDIYKPN